MGINYSKFHNAARQQEVKDYALKIRKLTRGSKLILSCDRLDYSKGILHRVMAFDILLKNHPEYIGKVTMMMVVVPSRDKVEKYAELKKKIDQLTGAVNGKYSQLDWVPVRYMYRSLPFEQLTALYKICDVALVTPLRDGMNLVAKEYIATKSRNDHGVLILSEMAGAAAEQHNDAVMVNPNDVTQIATAIDKALCMSDEEQHSRLANLQSIVSHNVVSAWATEFMEGWDETIKRNNDLMKKNINDAIEHRIHNSYKSSLHRLFVLDYDGTLVGFKNNPDNAFPTDDVKVLLRHICENKANKIVINSGRDHKTLEHWFGDLPVDIAAEHGAFIKEDGQWKENIVETKWEHRIKRLLTRFVDRTPGSHIETKQTSLAWHYRETDPWLGNFRSRQLINALLP